MHASGSHSRIGVHGAPAYSPTAKSLAGASHEGRSPTASQGVRSTLATPPIAAPRVSPPISLASAAKLPPPQVPSAAAPSPDVTPTVPGQSQPMGENAEADSGIVNSISPLARSAAAPVVVSAGPQANGVPDNAVEGPEQLAVRTAPEM
eukprot:evm.model.scf_178.1 EVM.evm.TU.scf_178.1   scf_178:26341-28048(-)